MFVYSMRATTVRFFGVVILSVLALAVLIAFVPELAPVAAAGVAPEGESFNYEGIRTAEDRIAFLSQFGWEADPAVLEETTVRIPAEFDKVFAAYNELQREQGLDLTSHAGKTVERYTYRITNYEGYEGEVHANLLVFRGHVIGGDICSADASGFLHGFTRS